MPTPSDALLILTKAHTRTPEPPTLTWTVWMLVMTPQILVVKPGHMLVGLTVTGEACVGLKVPLATSCQLETITFPVFCLQRALPALVRLGRCQALLLRVLQHHLKLHRLALQALRSLQISH